MRLSDFNKAVILAGTIFLTVAILLMFPDYAGKEQKQEKVVQEKTVTEKYRYNWAADQYERCVYGENDITVLKTCQAIFKEQIELLKVGGQHEDKGNLQ